MTEKNTNDKNPALITRKDFLKRMSYGAVGLAGMTSGNLFAMGTSGEIELPETPVTSPNIMITNARLIDGTGQSPQTNFSIRIHSGVIIETGLNLPVNNEVVFDVAGATVMPGLIDSHVHLASVPGAVFRDDDIDTQVQLMGHHLKSYLAAGVTTVLDTGISARLISMIQDYMSAGGIGPNIYALGPAFITPDGYMDDPRFYGKNGRESFPAAVTSRNDIINLLNEFESIPGIIGAKVLMDYGMGPWDVWPIHSPEIRDIIIEETSARNLPLWVHAMDEPEQTIAIEMSAKTIAHAGFLNEKVSDSHVSRLRDSGVYINTTLTVANFQRGEFHHEWVDTDLARLLIPENERLTAKNCSAWKDAMATLYDLIVPESQPEFMKKFVYAIRGISNLSQTSNAAKSLKKMYDAGIPLTLGSDAGNWAVFLNYFHGWSSIIELEHMKSAGMPLSAILTAATKTPSEMMGLSDSIGTIEPEKTADMIVLGDDPLSDIEAYRSLLWTIKNGIIKTPEEWIAS